MLKLLYDLLFGCRHRRHSFPITLGSRVKRRPEAALVTGTYVVCLDCGREQPYDWAEMRTLPMPKPKRPVLAPLTDERMAALRREGLI